MSTQVSTEAYLQAKVNILEEDVRSKNDKIALLEAYFKQIDDNKPVQAFEPTEVTDEGR